MSKLSTGDLALLLEAFDNQNGLTIYRWSRSNIDAAERSLRLLDLGLFAMTDRTQLTVRYEITRAGRMSVKRALAAAAPQPGAGR